jgi:hypothetical protein
MRFAGASHVLLVLLTLTGCATGPDKAGATVGTIDGKPFRARVEGTLAGRAFRAKTACFLEFRPGILGFFLADRVLERDAIVDLVNVRHEKSIPEATPEGVRWVIGGFVVLKEKRPPVVRPVVEHGDEATAAVQCFRATGAGKASSFPATGGSLTITRWDEEERTLSAELRMVADGGAMRGRFSGPIVYAD